MNLIDGHLPATMKVMDFSKWLLESTRNLEDDIFNALDRPGVSQKDFNKMLREWISSTDSHWYPPDEDGRKQPSFALPRNRGGSDSSVYLSGQMSPALAKISRSRRGDHGMSGLGLIVQPFTSDYLKTEVVQDFDAISIDNGRFTQKGRDSFTWDKYEKMIKVALAQEKRGVLNTFLFFTVPDEPYDWKKTMDLYNEYKGRITPLREAGAPVAICIQEGATTKNVPFGEIDVIFIGGRDAYKTGKEAREIVDQAQAMNIRVHMGRVNNNKRINTASDWGVDTVDGTYLMHELGKTLHEIERRNPRRRGEHARAYDDRIKRILHGEQKDGDTDQTHLNEPEIVRQFVDRVIDNQTNSRLMRRYRAIAAIVKQYGPVTKEVLGHFPLPTFPGSNHGDEVVEFDDEGKILLDANKMPVINKDMASNLNLRMPWRELPEGIPQDKNDYKVYTKYMNRYIAAMRDRGIMPR